ncbi:hypothetical protein GcM1_109003, partial [Golovinomyces cichoracearum]
ADAHYQSTQHRQKRHTITFTAADERHSHFPSSSVTPKSQKQTVRYSNYKDLSNSANNKSDNSSSSSSIPRSFHESVPIQRKNSVTPGNVRIKQRSQTPGRIYEISTDPQFETFGDEIHPSRHTSKRRSLGKATFLGMVKDMRCLDTTQLLGGESMVLPCALSKLGIGYRVSALIDSGANGYAFISRSLLMKISRMLKPHKQSLDSSISVKGFNGVAGRPITHFVTLNLTIDHHLDNCDLILGRQWLAHHQVLPDYSRRQLIWPRSYPPTFSCSRQIVLQLNSKSSVNSEHQRDANRRKALLDHEERRLKNSPKSLRINICDNNLLNSEYTTETVPPNTLVEPAKLPFMQKILPKPVRPIYSVVSSYL